MKHLIAISIFLQAGLMIAFAQHTNESLIVQEKRNGWIQLVATDLMNIIPDSAKQVTSVTALETENEIRFSVRIQKEARIDLPGGNWIYIITNSSHDDPEIGDVSVAIDNTKKLFYNEGHVCGGIINFETTKLKKLNSGREFFKYFISDTDNMNWKKIKM
jgi:hypothetical protein